jgi:DNA (cytosine-5)-methyltransferase 1
MTHGSLFSGIGGFDLAAEWMGWQNVFHCEWNTFGQKVLKYYWPDAISYNDITQTDFTIHRGRIDILTGGFPCQPYSMAGKRLGKEDDRHLWPEMLRAIREIQPRWVVGENVLGLVNWNGGLVFHEVQTDLEAEGYEVQPYVLPAAAVGAPHRRDRVWFVAKNTMRSRCIHRELKQEGAEIREQRDIGAGDTERICGEEMAGITSNANGIGRDNGSDNRGERQVPHDQERIPPESESERGGRFGWTGQICRDGDAPDTNGIGLRGKSDGIGNSRFFGKDDKASNWENFPTVSPICSRNDGISDRLDGITFSKWRQESIKAGGNAVVPQVVLQIFKAIAEYEELIIQRPSV